MYEHLLVNGYRAAGYWPLDDTSGNAADRSGNGRTATVSGTPTYRLPGPTSRLRYAVDLVGSAYFTTTAINLATVPGQPFTMGGWFRQDAPATDKALLSDWAANSGAMFYTDGSRFRVYYNGSFLSPDIRNLVAQRWHFMVATYDGTPDYRYRLWMDGQPVLSAVSAGAIGNGPAGFQIGTYAAGAGGKFNGRVAGCFVLDQRLTGAEIRRLMAAATGQGAKVPA